MKRLLVFLSTICIVSFNTYAYDFSAVCSTGQTLYYNITSDSTVEVTYPGNMGYQYVYFNTGYGNTPTLGYTSPYTHYSMPGAYGLPNGTYAYTYSATSSVSPYSDKKIRIPEYVENGGINYRVASISNFAFWRFNGIIVVSPSVVIADSALWEGQGVIVQYGYYNDGIRYVDNSQQYIVDCENTASSVIIPTSVTEIGNYAFEACSSLNKIILPNNVTKVGYRAFKQCTNLDSLFIGTGVKYIKDSAFVGCPNLRYVAFNAHECYQMNCHKVFWGDDNITTIDIGQGVARYPDSSFSFFQSLFDTIPWRISLRYIGCWNFANRNESMNIGQLARNVDTIAHHAFYNCDNLISTTINAHYVGRNAFAECDRLVSVTLGDSVHALGNGAFNGCFRLQNIDLGGATTIGDSAFNGCVRLENPELPATLTTIGTRAFNGCSLLAGKLTFPATITSIGDYAYSGVGTITEIEMLGANPPTIYANTFASVSNTTPVSVPCGAVLSCSLPGSLALHHPLRG